MFGSTRAALKRWFSKVSYLSRAIDKDSVGLRLDQFLKARGVKWASVHKSLRNRYYYVRTDEDKMMRDAGYRLALTDQIFYPNNSELHQYLESQSEEPQFFKLPKEDALRQIESMLIFQNKDIIVLNKKAGYATQGGQDFEKNLFTLLISCYDRSAIHIMHRLDLPCSGIVMFAKSAEAARLIQPAITGREFFHKYYLAKVAGQPNPSAGLIDCNIDWNNNKKRARLSSPTIKESQTALTYYSVVDQSKDSSLCLIKILTGRKHQIRCHMAYYLQTPIINDTLYGAEKASERSDSIRLHSFMLGITSQPIISMFHTRSSTNLNGSVNLENGTLWITAAIPWRKEVSDQSQQYAVDTARRLVSYSPTTTRKKKFVTY